METTSAGAYPIKLCSLFIYIFSSILLASFQIQRNIVKIHDSVREYPDVIRLLKVRSLTMDMYKTVHNCPVVRP